MDNPVLKLLAKVTIHNCEYLPNLTLGEEAGIEWMLRAMNEFVTKGQLKDDEPSKYFLEGFAKIRAHMISVHDVCHARDKTIEEKDREISRLKEELRQLHIRCDSLESIVAEDLDEVQERAEERSMEG